MRYVVKNKDALAKAVKQEAVARKAFFKTDLDPSFGLKFCAC